MQHCIVPRDIQPLDTSNKLLVITGAGISAESGIPTYRGPDMSDEESEARMALMSRAGLRERPESVWNYLNEVRALVHKAQPNQAHQILARWEQGESFASMMVATQNIDGLHLDAGSQSVSQMHGNVWQLSRPRSTPFAEDPQFSEDVELMAIPELRDEILQRWSEENESEIWENRELPFSSIPPDGDDSVRPNVVLFDEPYGSRLVWVEDYIARQKPDAVLVVGCSGGVTLLDYLLRKCRDSNPDCRIVNINPHQDPVEMAHEHLPMTASEGLTALETG